MKLLSLKTISQYFERRKHPDHTVSNVDLNRFQGRWYEIAAIPHWFEKNCECTTSEYSNRGNYLEVTNSCRKEGKSHVRRAKAYPVPDSGNSQLKLQYLWPLQRDYWIISRDEDYQYAVIGHPTKKYLWLLAREPHIDNAMYESMVSIAQASGYEVDKLEKTNQYCSA
jgi:apolipoprotein D and lipocalin family protein